MEVSVATGFTMHFLPFATTARDCEAQFFSEEEATESTEATEDDDDGGGDGGVNDGDKCAIVV